MKRVGFVLNLTGQGWLGGVSYYRNLLGALMGLPDRAIDPVILTADHPEALGAARDICRIEPTGSALVDPARMVWKARRILQRYGGRDWLFEHLARAQRIDLFSHSGHLGARSPVATLPWIPDFQELHYPEFFTPQDRAARLRSAREAGHNATAILLSSDSARQDLGRIDSAFAAKAEILRFVADVLPRDRTPDPTPVLAEHGVSAPYFLLPNQFWAHKNHIVVVEALAVLKARGFASLVVATGNMADHRQPGHFGQLMQRVREAGVEDVFRPIGTVSYDQLMALMRGAVALINPSLFEGWSTTVEEAKSLGKAIALSDIAVHREQAPPRGRYFDPRQPEDLADALETIWRARDAEADRAAQRQAEQDLPQRRLAFARSYQEIALRTIARGQA
ncbi:glycosyltransferase family 4 protein [Bradyrhizobium sp. HKCCYLS2038]|uniref:glycosyltransferase family 4 protein n=1 Tax=unclassified Bradyrhizobium TaxID=2631580 RepID=UPI003EB7B66B